MLDDAEPKFMVDQMLGADRTYPPPLRPLPTDHPCILYTGNPLVGLDKDGEKNK